jgi:1,4-dihydroxy-2-naphthoate octaprenyltransferase
VTAILVVNNLRDIDTDRTTGKVTLGVVMGDRLTRWWYTVTVVAPYVLAIAAWPLGFANPFVLLVLASLPMAFRLLRGVHSGTRGRALNLTLKATARWDRIFGALFAAGLALS